MSNIYIFIMLVLTFNCLLSNKNLKFKINQPTTTSTHPKINDPPSQQLIAKINPTQNQQSPNKINDPQKTQQLRSKSSPQSWVTKLKVNHKNADPPSSLPPESLPQPPVTHIRMWQLERGKRHWKSQRNEIGLVWKEIETREGWKEFKKKKKKVKLLQRFAL